MSPPGKKKIKPPLDKFLKTLLKNTYFNEFFILNESKEGNFTFLLILPCQVLKDEITVHRHFKCAVSK